MQVEKNYNTFLLISEKLRNGCHCAIYFHYLLINVVNLRHLQNRAFAQNRSWSQYNRSRSHSLSYQPQYF